MKLSQYAKKLGISYRTAWRWFKNGQLQGYQVETGTVIVTEPVAEAPVSTKQKIAVYARVSSSENRSNLDSQAERLTNYCIAKGYQVEKITKEVGSGINDTRRELLRLLTDATVTVIVVEHKDRLARLGFNYIEQLLAMQGRRIEVVNLAEDGKEGLLDDLVAIIYSFCARLYGQRCSKRKTQRIIEELEADEIGRTPRQQTRT